MRVRRQDRAHRGSRAGWLLLCACLASPLLGAASDLVEAGQQVDGMWRGDSFVLKVDSKRAQANVDGARPYNWQRFLVKEAGRGEIVFSIGSELFQAKLASDKLTLTSTTFRGERVLRRSLAEPEVPLLEALRQSFPAEVPASVAAGEPPPDSTQDLR